MRFINFFKRKYSTIILNFYPSFIEQYWKTIKNTKWKYFKWKGLSLMKDPMSLTIYLQMLQDIKPQTIIEFGTGEGGFALWMRDVMQSLDLACVIHTFDIKNKTKLTANIFWHKVDASNIKQYMSENKKLMESLPHPILVIEDWHVNLLETLESVEPLMKTGDYLVVEDTIDPPKYQILSEHLQNDKYVVDSHYCDFWGYNNSWNINSILKVND